MIKAIAFDFDGVLAESFDIKTKAFADLFAAEPPHIIEQILKYHTANGGISRFVKIKHIYKDILKRPLSDADFQASCQRYSQLVEDAVVASSWVKGAKEFLDRYAQTYTFFIASATPEPELLRIVQRRGMADYFADVRGAPPTKDKLLQEIMAKHSLTPEELIFVGDADNDRQAALHAGVSFVWRRNGDPRSDIPNYRGPTIADLKSLHLYLAEVQSQTV